jgi:hypothetical protein
MEVDNKFYCVACCKEFYKRTYNKHRKSATHQKREIRYLNRKNIRCRRTKKEPKEI